MYIMEAELDEKTCIQYGTTLCLSSCQESALLDETCEITYAELMGRLMMMIVCV